MRRFSGAPSSTVSSPLPVMAVMMLMASKPEVMGDHTIPASLRIVGWIAVSIMVLSVTAMAVASLM